MEDENIENQDSQNLENEELENENQDDSEDVDTLKAKNQSLYEQLKKAKGFIRGEDGKWIKKPETKAPVKQEAKSDESENLSPKDLYALSQANVHLDDFDDVVEYAKFKKISIADALKSDVIKATLANKSEYRKTAEVTNTGNARKSVSKVSDEALAENLKKGQVPKKGSEEAERLFWARRGGKR